LFIHDRMLGLPIGVLVTDEGLYFGEQHNLWLASATRQKGLDRGVPKNLTAVTVATAAVARAWSNWLPPLPDTDKEAVSVAAHFARSNVLIGTEATVEQVARALPHAEVFHYAGHSYSSSSGTGLLLAPDSGSDSSTPALFTSERLEQLNLKHIRLAVLSSCETDAASSPYRLSLARLFLQAGAEWVVATGWNANSSVSVRLMEIFYDKLSEGNSVPGALRIAAAAVRADPATQHPYYWAVFLSYGPH
jgi:CHAT domain-containing protein